MKAALIFGKGDIRLENVELPPLKPDEVKVAIKACGICHFDLRFYNGSKQVARPFVLGHECCGVVDQVGAEVTHVKPGDRVAVSTDIPCGHCGYCIAGKTNFCSNRVSADGGFAEYLVAPGRQAFKFSDSTSFDEACLTEPLACCMNGSLRGGIRPSSSVAVVGAGPIGLLHVQLARIFGASKVIAVDPLAPRRQKAMELGADAAVDPKGEDATKEVVRLTDGLGADAVIVAVENLDALEQGIKMVAKQGTAVLFAGFHPTRELKVDANSVHYNEISLTGSSDFPISLFPQALKVIDSHRIQLKPIISHHFPLEKINEGFGAAMTLQGLKVIITP